METSLVLFIRNIGAAVQTRPYHGNTRVLRRIRSESPLTCGNFLGGFLLKPNSHRALICRYRGYWQANLLP